MCKSWFISCLKESKLIIKRSIYHLVWDRDVNFIVPSLESVPAVK